MNARSTILALFVLVGTAHPTLAQKGLPVGDGVTSGTIDTDPFETGKKDAEAAPTFVLQSAEEKYSSETAKGYNLIDKAEAEAARIKHAAAAARLKAYRDKLTEVTKTGDFDKAIQIKAKIELLEKDPEFVAKDGSKKTRPSHAIKSGSHYYALINEPVTWHVAKRKCEEMGGHLVCIKSKKEADFVAGMCKKITAWVGSSDEETEGKWVNVDGSAPIFTKALFDNASNWEHWMTWDGVSQHYNDLNTGARLPFVCEWDR